MNWHIFLLVIGIPTAMIFDIASFACFAVDRGKTALWFLILGFTGLLLTAVGMAI